LSERKVYPVEVTIASIGAQRVRYLDLSVWIVLADQPVSAEA
jgi:hypothetical protein